MHFLFYLSFAIGSFATGNDLYLFIFVKQKVSNFKKGYDKERRSFSGFSWIEPEFLEQLRHAGETKNSKTYNIADPDKSVYLYDTLERVATLLDKLY